MCKPNEIIYYLVSPLEVKVDSLDDDGYSSGFELETMPSSVLRDQLDDVRNMIRASLIDGHELINLMEYFSRYDSPNYESIQKKTTGFMPDIQVVNGEIMGVSRLYCSQELSQQELTEVREYISGQYSDGWGEGFEQQPLKSEYGDLYISFWSLEDEYSIETYTQEQWDSLKNTSQREQTQPER